MISYLKAGGKLKLDNEEKLNETKTIRQKKLAP